jgi:3-hydroxyacyl-CoA dehydrogenase
VVDDLTGAKLGRAKSGTFRTADVVGLDTMGHVIKTMQDTLPDDPFAAIYKTPDVLTKLVAAGALGQKTGAGFYKKSAARYSASISPRASTWPAAVRPTTSWCASSRKRTRPSA